MVGLCVRELHCARGPSTRTDARRTSRRSSDGAGRRGSVRRHAEALEGRTLLAAAPAPAGAEFRVNTQTAGSQELFAEAPHAVAADADGDFVVTWSSSGQDGSSWGVYAQRYAADGSPRGAEFRVNQATGGNQWYPTVASDAAGNFVVAWTSAGQDGSGDGVYARRYNAAGLPQGAEFRVNTTTAGEQRHPAVAMAAGGAFVVTWSGYGQAGGAGWDVYAQRFDAFANPQGGEVLVNGAAAAGDQQFASVAADETGDFVVAWTSDGQDGSGAAAYARRFNAAGAAQGGEFRVNTTTAGNQHYARVAADADGDFVVAWASANQDGSGRGVYAQRYAAGGAKRGGEFLVNQVTAGEQFAPTVASDADGGFVVTWTGAQDGDLFGVFARAYDSVGAARGDEFRVNTYSAGNQVYSAAASAPDGKLVVVWQSDGQDGSFFGVYGQRYAAPDSDPPVANITDVAPDPRNTSLATITVAFSEPVVGVDRTDFTLTRNGGADLLGASQTVTTSNGGITWTLGGLSGLTAPDGNYVLTLKPSGTGITDAAGNPLSGGATDQWVLETVKPTADVIDVTPDPRDGAVGDVVVRFSEPVSGVTLSDFRLTRDGGPNLLTPAQLLAPSNGSATWTLSNLAPVTALPGTYTLTLVAAASGIVDLAGNALAADASDNWAVAAPSARVVGRHVFYNGSSFDGGDGSAAASDDLAIATDKAALLPAGGRAAFANYTSSPRGLNGVMVDVAGLASLAGGAPLLSAADFAFRFGDTANPAAWPTAPAPTSVTVRPGAGIGGSDRVTLVWQNGALVRGWLQLSVLATPSTRLASPDVFYFGNLPGETGDDPDAAAVDALDLAATRAAASAGEVAVSSRYDHNRDGRVDVRDIYIVRTMLDADDALPLLGSSAPAAASFEHARRTAYRPTATSVLSAGHDGDSLLPESF